MPKIQANTFLHFDKHKKNLVNSKVVILGWNA